ncbi:O-antigen ligase family protein [Psychrobacillus soli]|uniref:O-antigen ligase family protein n=1 Tax=Psychrobacillus soli TaxID=1543965 RepID=A0A544TL28_9BACI|nr:O-antigen ligase family protein [Psychrobacillus soli]TQR18153.1 O-antigen ligase family protein [Psychrobacillus soli]
MSYTLHRKVHIKRDKEEDRRSQQQVDKWILYSLLAAIVLVPLLVGGHVTNVVSPLIADASQLVSGEKIDFFTFYKFIALIILTVIATSLFLYKFFFLDYRLPKRPILWFFALFLLAIVLATTFSPSKTIALYGQYNRTDGALSYICYILLMFVAMHIQYPKKVVEYVLYAFYPLVIINFVVTTMNFTNHDALMYGPLKTALTLFAPEIVVGENSQLLGTLNHWNYMSGMFAIVTIMYLSWIVIDTNKVRRVINFVFAILAMTTMLIAMSASGFVTFVCITPLIIWLAIKSSNKKMAFISLVIFTILTAGILHVLSMKDPEAWDESIGFFLPGNPYIDEQSVDTSLNDDTSWAPSILLGAKAFAADEVFQLPELPESAWGPGTGRIYIWQKTLHLLSERPLFGYGLDTLMYNFPHNDIEARSNLTVVTIVDKPHSLYVGVAYGTGIVGIVGFLGIIIYTVCAAVMSIIRFKVFSGLTVILCIGWLAFLVQALFNDSLPGTTASLFAIAGIMMAQLYNKKEISGSINERNI